MVDDETIREFLVESHEALDQMERDFVALEVAPDDLSRLAAVFRAVHTIKGVSGFLGFSALGEITHVGETLLAQLRDGSRTLTPPIYRVLMRLTDRVRAILKEIEAKGREPGDSHADLLAELVALASDGSAPTVELVSPEDVMAELAAPPVAAPAVAAPPGAAPPPPVAPVPDPVPRPAPAASVPTSTAAPAVTEEAGAATLSASAVSDSSVRVDVGLLDKLMNLVGELVLARNQIIQLGARRSDSVLVEASQRLDLITTELQAGVMKTRMQPIGTVWNKLPRVVRDVSVACRKQVRTEMFGKDTELDRTIIEAIKDPLIHIIRNAVDHGIELPDVRIARGKPRTGTITLRAYHEGGQVIVEIGDDGAGIDLDRVRAKARDKGLVTPERLARMTDREICQLICLPGFSTAEQVTSVSGRGVGMDVVKTNIERIGGSLELLNHPGSGTTLRIKIPLTLAIVPALVIDAGGQRFALPQASLVELVRADGEGHGIETIHGAPVYRLRGRLLPLVYLEEVLGSAPSARLAQNVVVLKADDRTFGLVVDRICDTEEIVVKPLGNELKTLSVYAGATIMGDGRVALILDVMGIAERAHAISTVRERTASETTSAAGTDADQLSTEGNLLVLEVSGARMAIPLAAVDRLEEIDTRRVEQLGMSQVVQYRDELLPLVDLASALGVGVASPVDPVPVIVFSQPEGRVGLVVDKVIDVVDPRGTTRPRGVNNARVIDGRVTALIDVADVVRSALPRAGGLA